MPGEAQLCWHREVAVKRVLCVCHYHLPELNATSIRTDKVLSLLSDRWLLTVIAKAPASRKEPPHHTAEVRGRSPERLFAALRRLRLGRLIPLMIWPDVSIFWVPGAIREALRQHRRAAADAIFVFMMPYSAGLVGVALKSLTGLPLVLNFDDSPTCSDMQPTYQTGLHRRLATWLEDYYVRRADAVVYVSSENLAAVRSRQPPAMRSKFHLIRYGADPADYESRLPRANSDSFTIRYVGRFSGWYELYEQQKPPSQARSLLRRFEQLGYHRRISIHQPSSSPLYLGYALESVVQRHPHLRGRCRIEVYGDEHPPEVIRAVLAAGGIESLVRVYGPVRNKRAVDLMRTAELLFMAIPDRLDDSRGGRISAKTYEYLMTDRPILAAVPPGENWDYLDGRDGVWLARPRDVDTMREAVLEVATAWVKGAPLRYDRRHLRDEVGYHTRAQQLHELLIKVIGSHDRYKPVAELPLRPSRGS